MSTLDEILHGQPAAIPPPPPVRRHRRHDYTGYMQAHPPTGSVTGLEHLFHEDLIGAEFFDPAPEPARVPQTVPDGMHKIGDLARALGREPRTIRLWIKNGIIPDAPERTAGRDFDGGLGRVNNAKRLWPASEINAIALIAREEGITDRPHTAWLTETNFKQRVWDAVLELRASPR